MNQVQVDRTVVVMLVTVPINVGMQQQAVILKLVLILWIFQQPMI